MKKIAHIICDLLPGGGQKSAIDLIHATNDIAQNYLILLEDKKDYVPENIEVRSLVKNKRIYKKLDIIGDILLSYKLKKLLKELEIDVAISHMEVVSKILTFVNIPKIFFIRTDIVRELERIKERSYFRFLKKRFIYAKILNNEHLFTVSKGVAKRLQTFLKPKSITTFYTPFDFDTIERKSMQNSLKLPNKYLLFLGGTRREKGLPILLKAFLKLKHEDIDLVLLDVNEEQLKLDLHVRKRVHCFSFQSNPYPFIKNATLLVLASEQEGLPRVLVESLFLKTPIVSTDCNCGPREIMVDELSQFLANVNDSDDLAKKIDLALTHYPSITQLYIKNFMKEKNIKIYTNQLERLYQASL